jgi:hypothetical protein
MSLIRKWYFCLSQSSIDRDNHGWEDMVFVAVKSALRNTNLQPILLFDGEPSFFISQLELIGVKVIYHRVSFYEDLKQRDSKSPGYLSIASGAFLRTEIPMIEDTDDFVLYTDCDIVFFSDNFLINQRPHFFSCAPQSSKSDYLNDANSGVLVINVKNMRDTYPDFRQFIVDNLYSGWPGCDQENYRRFYHGKWDNLPLVANWKPYWGFSEDIEILHWHGPKPEAIYKKLQYQNFVLYRDWDKLYSRNPDAYEQYLWLWDDYNEPSISEKLIPITPVSGFIDELRLSDDRKTLSVRGWSYLCGKSLFSRCVIELDSMRFELTRYIPTNRLDVSSALPSVPVSCGFVMEINNDPGFSNLGLSDIKAIIYSDSPILIEKLSCSSVLRGKQHNVLDPFSQP